MRAGLTGVPFWPLGAGFAGIAFRPLGTGLTSVALRSLRAGLTGVPFWPLGAGLTGVTLRPLGAGLAGIAFRPLRAGLTGVPFWSLRTGLTGSAVLAVFSVLTVGAVFAIPAVKQPGIGIGLEGICHRNGGFRLGKQALDEGGGGFSGGIFLRLGAGAYGPQQAADCRQDHFLPAGAVYPHTQVLACTGETFPRDEALVILPQQAADADGAGGENGGAIEGGPLRGEAEPHRDGLYHTGGEKFILGHGDGGPGDLTNDHKFPPCDKIPCTNTAKWPLFCMRKVNISLFLMENLQYWRNMG